MNIADDVYRKQHEEAELTDEQVTKLIKTANAIDADMSKEINDKINKKEIHGINYKAALAKLERLAGGK